MLCFTQDADTNKKFPDQFSPTTYGCFAFSISLFSKQNSLSQQQPPLGQTWYISSLVRYVSLAVVVRQECSTQNMPHIGHTNSFSQLYSSSKIKRQKDAISLNVLSCAHAQVSHVTRSGRRMTKGLKVAPNFTSNCGLGCYSCRLFLSSQNVIHLYLRAHFSTLYWHFHVRYWRTKQHIRFLCVSLQRSLVLSECRFGFFNVNINLI